MKKHYKSKIAAIAVGTAIKVLTGVVCGAVVLTGTYGVVKNTVLPNSTAKTQSMFAYEGEAGTGGTGGSASDNPIYQTELKRNGVIPAGGTYKVKATNAVLSEGDSFPETPATGDTYEEGYYTYKYNMEFDLLIWDWNSSPSQNGWSVRVKDDTKTEYGEIPSEIAGKPVTNMYCTFKNCTSLTTAPTIPNSVTKMASTFDGCTSLTTAPTIPSSVTTMGGTFRGCTSLTTAPVIPSSIPNMYSTFYGCTSLTGTIEINASPTNYFNCFYGTTNPITLTGSSTILSELAATANNGNVTVG